MIRKIRYAAAIILLPIIGFSTEAFKQNDRVAFIGDSITHGGSYHTIIQHFYATRFPQLNVACFNVGISGDNAQGGYQRASLTGDGIWESDVRRVNPTAATIMLGMNDVGRWHINSSDSKEALMKEHEKMLGWYQGNYRTLLDNLEKLGLERITLIKSSPYDQTMVNPEARENLLNFGFGKNDAILDFAEKGIEVEAARRGYPVCDFNMPMLGINAEQQKKDPAFSIIGNDRIHPGPMGHAVMAFTFLKFQELEGPVASLELDTLLENSGTESKRCSVSDLEMQTDKISFIYRAESLPLYPASYAEARHLIPVEENFNQETLCIKNLDPGTYELVIDGAVVAEVSNRQFAEGINLALMKTPQAEQARVVYLNCKKQAAISARIRDVVWSVGYLGKIKGHNASGREANLNMIRKIEEGFEPEGLWAAPRAYEKGVLANYVKYIDEYDILFEVLENTIRRTYALAEPKPHHVEIRRIKLGNK